MTLERNYRKEAKTARAAARETLMAFRQARLQSKTRAKRRVASPVTVDSDGSLIAPETFFSIEPAQTEAASEDTALASDAVADANDETGDTTGSAQVIPAEPTVDETTEGVGDVEESVVARSSEDEPAIDVETPPKGNSNGDVPPEPDAASGEAESTESIASLPDEAVGEDAPLTATQECPASDASLAKVDANSDLFELPGAGAGMVWMFHQCGITSLSDLADADARDLSLRLGVVGHILNVEPWISFAKEKLGRTGQ